MFFMDSFGVCPYFVEFFDFLLKQSSFFYYNTFQFQSVQAATCGEYVSVFAHYLCSGLAWDTIKRQFSGRNTVLNDALIMAKFTKIYGHPTLKTKLANPMTCCSLCPRDGA